MNKNFVIFFFTCLSFSISAWCGVAGVYPIGLGNDTSKVVVVEMPKFDKYEMLREDSIDQINKIGGLRFAKQFKVNYSPDNSGTLVSNSDGSKRWRIGFKSDSAYSINLIFSKFHLVDGDTLFIYNVDTTTVIGPLTNKNNLKSGILPTTDLVGDEVIVDFRQSTVNDTTRALCVGDVDHDYRGMRIAPKDISATADSCSIHASCDVDAAQIKQSVCLLVINGSYYCSGAIINNTAKDGTPYLISAAHCFSESSPSEATAEAENNALATVVYFNYEAPACDKNIRGSQEFYIAGTTLKAFAEDLDLALVELSSIPPVDFRVYYAGWNIGTSPSPTYKCIHHPYGTVKRIASCDNINNATMNIETLNYSILSDSHWQVPLWTSGTTDNGSSGSALFDETGHIIGCLTGGSSTCVSPVNDYFYRLNKAWNYYSESSKQLKAWLDPNNSGVSILDGMNPYGNDSASRVSNITKADSPAKTYLSIGGLTTGQNTYGITEYAEEFNLNKNAYLLGFYLIPYSTKFICNVNVYSDVLDNEPIETYTVSSPSIMQWNRSSSTFYTSTKSTTKDNENYIRLNKKLAVGKKFYISYAVSYDNLPTDSFGVYSAIGSSRINTAYALLNGSWCSLVKACNINNSSLWIDPVLVYNDSANVSDTSLIQRTESITTIYPNPVNPNIQMLRISTRILSDTSCKIEMFSISGQKIKDLIGKVCKTDILLDMSNIPDGVYIIKIKYTDSIENHKVIVARY